MKCAKTNGTDKLILNYQSHANNHFRMNECKCLNNGQCMLNNETSNFSCVCSDCTGGEYCENIYYYVLYLMSSSMSIDILLEESSSTRITLKILFISILSLLAALSFINNLLTFSTCFKRKIRITVCGLYIIVHSITSFIGIVFVEIIAVVTLFYNNELEKHPLIYCTLLPTFQKLAYDICLWMSAFIAVERVFIQFGYYSIYRTRKYSFIVLIILFFTLSSGSGLYAIGRIAEKSPVLSTTSYVCTFHHFPSESVKIAYKVMGSMYPQVVIPLLLIFLSIVLTLTHIIRHKITLTDLERNSWQSLIMQQILKHKDFFISPLVIIICTLPEKILTNAATTYCVEKSMQRFYLRLHIAFDFLLYVPLFLTFFIYIYPSNVYMKVFREIAIIKWIKLNILDRRSRKSSNTVEEVNDQQSVEETNL